MHASLQTATALALSVLLTFEACPKPRPSLLDEVLAKPGYWTQMCDTRVIMSPRTVTGMPPVQVPTHVPPLPLFGYERWSETKFSPENFLRLRKQRSQVIREISSRLEAGKPADQAYWMILLDLNGIEALRALLRFEKQFKVKRLQVGLDVRDCAHIQVLSVITALLKNERVAGLSRLEPIYNQQQRDAIVELANSFLKSTPPQNFRAAAGMKSEPVPR